jgi:hypothetical protein
MAFDGSFTSASWASNGQNINFWIQIQVSTPQVYDSFEIAGRSDGAEYPTGMIWQGSNDAIAWFDIIAATGLPSRFLAANDPTLANTKLFCSSNKAAYNYYRWSFPTGTGSNPGISGIKVFNLSTNPGTEIDNANLTTVAERIYFNAPYTLSSAQISYGLTCWNTLSSGVLNYAVFSGNGATKVSEAKLSNSNSTFDHKQVMSPMVIKNILQGNYPINPLALNANTRIESSNDYQLISASIGISR